MNISGTLASIPVVQSMRGLSTSPPIITAEIVQEPSDEDKIAVEYLRLISQLDIDVLRARLARLMAVMQLDIRSIEKMARNAQGDRVFKAECLRYLREQESNADAFYKFILTGRS